MWLYLGGWMCAIPASYMWQAQLLCWMMFWQVKVFLLYLLGAWSLGGVKDSKSTQVLQDSQRSWLVLSLFLQVQQHQSYVVSSCSVINKSIAFIFLSSKPRTFQVIMPRVLCCSLCFCRFLFSLRSAPVCGVWVRSVSFLFALVCGRGSVQIGAQSPGAAQADNFLLISFDFPACARGRAMRKRVSSQKNVKVRFGRQAVRSCNAVDWKESGDQGEG